MARFLIDEDLPRSVARQAGSAGVDAVHVLDAGLRGAADATVLAWAVNERRALVTADRELGNILLYPPSGHHGVVVIRIPEELGLDVRIAHIVAAMGNLIDVSLTGAVVVVEPGRVRVRRPQ